MALVSVAILEAKDLNLERSGRSFVRIKLGAHVRNTKPARSDAPRFNEVFYFPFRTLHHALENTIHFHVIKFDGWFRKSRLAEVDLPLKVVWEAPGHEIARQWLQLRGPARLIELAGEGYLKVQIQIQRAGDPLAPELPPPDPAEEESVETNLFKPRHAYATYEVKIYRADGLPEPAAGLHICAPYHKTQIDIFLSELKGYSSKWERVSPSAIQFTEIFPPPVAAAVRVEMSRGGSEVLASHSIHLLSLMDQTSTNLSLQGLSFGPCYIHLYDESGSYCGRVLLSVSTREALPFQPHLAVLPCAPCVEQDEEVEMVVFCSLLGAHLLNKKYLRGKLVFKVSIGASQEADTTAPMRPVSSEGQLCSLPVGETAPCVTSVASWPVRRLSMFISNRLLALAALLEGAAGEMERQETTLGEALDGCVLEVRALIPALNRGGTQFDRNRAHLREAALVKVLSSMQEVREKAQMLTPRDKTESLRQFASELRELADDPQQSGMPDVCVQLLTAGGRHVVAQRTIPARSVLFSELPSERGTRCGHPFTLYLESEAISYSWEGTSQLRPELRLFMCLGLASEAPKFTVPEGCEPATEGALLSLPVSLLFTQPLSLECRVQVYHGRVLAGWDADGLCDPFLRVSCGGRVAETEIIPRTLCPVWNETLVLWPITAWESATSIADNPPAVLLEVLDFDEGEESEFVGRCSVAPSVSMLSPLCSAPRGPPALQEPSTSWITIKRGPLVVAKILASTELIERPPGWSPGPVQPPTELPRSGYSLSCLLLSLRAHAPLKGAQLIVECRDQRITVNVRTSKSQRCSTFETSLHEISMSLPTNPNFLPPVSVKLVTGGLQNPRLRGTCLVPSLQPFLQRETPQLQPSLLELTAEEVDGDAVDRGAESYVSVDIHDDEIDVSEAAAPLLQPSSGQHSTVWERFSRVYWGIRRLHNLQFSPGGATDSLDRDWWSKLPNPKKSLEFPDDPQTALDRSAVKLKLYDRPLEEVVEFSGFQDCVQPLSLVRGRRSRLEEPPQVALLTAGFQLRPSEHSTPPQRWARHQPPSQATVHLYVVRALNLRPVDPSGPCDSYLVIKAGARQIVSERDRCVPKTLNPVFGRSYRLVVNLPEEHEITVQVMDRDLVRDYEIGRTTVNIEERLSSHHRATCGLPARYNIAGYNRWRDAEPPSAILLHECAQLRLPAPEWDESLKELRVGDVTLLRAPAACRAPCLREQVSLAVLRRWGELTGRPLVPEHVESRPLTLRSRPGVLQGRVHMWLDLFPGPDPTPPPPIPIRPRPLEDYELRVTVWNARGLPLVYSGLGGGKYIDVVIKGRVLSHGGVQSTDVHDRSTTGEGQFHWRMVFRLLSISSCLAEQLLEPCTLQIQAFDRHLVADRGVGSLLLELSRLPGKDSGRVNLFAAKKLDRQWYGLTSDRKLPAGEVELEFQLLPAAEAIRNPVGRGRSPPSPLPAPKRPSSSFSWRRNPLRAAHSVLWVNHRRKLLTSFLPVALFILLFVFAFSVFEALPKEIVKKIIK